jgi:hypothetical protein
MATTGQADSNEQAKGDPPEEERGHRQGRSGQATPELVALDGDRRQAVVVVGEVAPVGMRHGTSLGGRQSIADQASRHARGRP